MTTLLRALSLSGLMAFAAPAYSQVLLDVRLGIPLPRPEVVLAPPVAGAIWIAGDYVFDARLGSRFWVPGHWRIPPERIRRYDEPRFDRDRVDRDRFDRDREQFNHRDGYRQDGRDGHDDRDRRDR